VTDTKTFPEFWRHDFAELPLIQKSGVQRKNMLVIRYCMLDQLRSLRLAGTDVDRVNCRVVKQVVISIRVQALFSRGICQRLVALQRRGEVGE